ncbi:hypothetical protein HU200_030872 [Digitaria exilis]|uniref:VQ domain-containing protein n=1 Tax=Digitaria exilis TaxID=1010633 RepID=A0A835BW41_9POAL|nr:hypothetical protein HU200_030872 [Digitaria exilis]
MDAGAAATTARERPAPPSPLPQASADPSNPFPTTFVQADTTSFKQVVQILTGTPETAAAAAAGGAQASPQAPQKPAPAPTGPKKPAFKLYERRSSMKSLKMLCPLLPAAAAFAAGGSAAANGFSPRGFSPRGLEVLSPSMLDFPSLALGSPVTPLPPLPGSVEAAAAEDRAIAEKGFYLHPRPAGAAQAAPALPPAVADQPAVTVSRSWVPHPSSKLRLAPARYALLAANRRAPKREADLIFTAGKADGGTLAVAAAAARVHGERQRRRIADATRRAVSFAWRSLLPR